MHPYKSAPAISFWNRSVSSDFIAACLLTTQEPLIRRGDRIATARSCFASHLVPYLEKAGYTYVRTERQHPAVAIIPAENFAYDAFSAAYGNIYTARQLLQLLQRSTGAFRPVEDRWHTEAGVLDPFRPGLRYHALTDREFDLLTRQHLDAVRHCELLPDVADRGADAPDANSSHAAAGVATGQGHVNARALSQTIVDAECEEAMAQRMSAAEYQPTVAPLAPLPRSAVMRSAVAVNYASTRAPWEASPSGFNHALMRSTKARVSFTRSDISANPVGCRPAM